VQDSDFLGQSLPPAHLALYSLIRIYYGRPMKTAAFNQVDRMFRAFSDPTRLRILNLLLGGELCVCDIVNALEMPQPTISRHLAYLKESGLAQTRREGFWMHYKLTTPQTTLHAKLIECLGCCYQDMPQLAEDSKALKRSRCC